MKKPAKSNQKARSSHGKEYTPPPKHRGVDVFTREGRRSSPKKAGNFAKGKYAS